MFCPWCGAQNPDEAAVCQKCGRALRPAGPLPVAPASAAGGYPQGFFARLFDFSFRGFITPTIISIIYGIVVVLCAFGAIALIGVAFRAGTAAGVITLILSPIIFLIYLIFARIWLEVTIVLFRIAEDVGEMLRTKRG